MGHCYSAQDRTDASTGQWTSNAAEDTLIPSLHSELQKDLKSVLGDHSLLGRRRLGRMLGKADLQRAYDFVELQMLLPRRTGDTQVLVLTAAQLACCGMLLQRPNFLQQCICVRELSMHVLFELKPLNMEAHGIALCTLARFLEDNTDMQRLNVNLMGITLISPVTSQARKIFSAVMLAFAAMLRVNNTLRLLRFEGMGGEVPWSFADAANVATAQKRQRDRRRLAVLMGQHPRSKDASPLLTHFPRHILRLILDRAIPLQPICKVEFSFDDESGLDELSSYIANHG